MSSALRKPARRTPARRTPRTRRPVRTDFDESQDYPEDIELLPDDDVEVVPPAAPAPGQDPAPESGQDPAPAPRKAAPKVEIDFDEDDLELDFLDTDE